jgi:hypothetical protein
MQDSPRYLEILGELEILGSNLSSMELEMLMNKGLFDETKKNVFLESLFSHTNALIAALGSLPANCSDELGGWEQIAASTLSTAAFATGISGFANYSVIGAGLQMSSALVDLFTNIEAKRAITNIIRYKNAKVLACTYQSIKHTACEFQRAYNYSRDTKKILDLIQQRYSGAPVGVFEKYFYLVERKDVFDQIFEKIASMGSSFTFDVELITKYFTAKKADPKSIVLIDNETATDEERTDWLNDVKIRGIQFAEAGFNGITSKKERVDEAIVDINNKISDIDFVEAAVMEKKSFVDLRHELDRSFPEADYLLDTLVDFLDDEAVIEMYNVENGPVKAARRLLVAIENLFLPNVSNYNDYQDYRKAIDEAGFELFKIMAEGAVAELSAQSVLTIGGKSIEKLDRALAVYAEGFQRKDLEVEGSPFSDFARGHALQLQVLMNYGQFSGSSLAFRDEDIQVTLDTFIKGFKGEIIRMVRTSLKRNDYFVEGLKGTTAAHLCALFNDFLKEHDRKSYKTCKERYVELEIVSVIEPRFLEIDYADGCFYSSFTRREMTQRSLLKRLKDVGLKP